MNWWSCDVKIIAPLKRIKPSFNAWIDSRSKWFVGSSNNNTFEFESIILESIQRTFSPPDNTDGDFFTSSPENSIRPKKPRRNDSVSSSGEYGRNHSTNDFSLPPKYWS